LELVATQYLDPRRPQADVRTQHALADAIYKAIPGCVSLWLNPTAPWYPTDRVSLKLGLSHRKQNNWLKSNPRVCIMLESQGLLFT
jgi:hypothetical protein